MPFISSFESGSRKYSPGSSTTSTGTGRSSSGSVFDRFGPRKNSVYERPSTYKPSTISSASTTTTTPVSKYRSSTLERPSDNYGASSSGTVGANSRLGGSSTGLSSVTTTPTTIGYSSPYSTTQQAVPKYQR